MSPFTKSQGFRTNFPLTKRSLDMRYLFKNATGVDFNKEKRATTGQRHLSLTSHSIVATVQLLSPWDRNHNYFLLFTLSIKIWSHLKEKFDMTLLNVISIGPIFCYMKNLRTKLKSGSYILIQYCFDQYCWDLLKIVFTQYLKIYFWR